MEFRDILTTYAEVAATLVGFSGVVFAIGRFSEGGWSPSERNGLIHLLLPAVCALFLAFVPIVASTGIPSEALIWRLSNGLLGATHLVLVTNGARNVLRKETPGPFMVGVALCVGGYMAVAANAIVVLGYLESFAVLVYVGGLTWLLFVSAVQFILLLLSHAHARAD